MKKADEVKRILAELQALSEEEQSLLVPLTDEDHEIIDGVRYIRLGNQYLRSWKQAGLANNTESS